LHGTFTGIGIYLRQDTNTKQIIITAPIPGSPAEKAGLKAAILLPQSMVQYSWKGYSISKHRDRGASWYECIYHNTPPATQQTLTFKIVRAEIQVPNVVMHYIPEDHIAHIQILQFAAGVSSQLKDALTKAKSLGAKKIILDLRDDREDT